MLLTWPIASTRNSTKLLTISGNRYESLWSIRVSTIDKDNLPYNIPVDLVIDQYNPQSWKDGIKHIIARAHESTNPTIVLLQHEYGLDPDEKGNDGDGTNFIEMANVA